jgi:hypothetical protein
MSPQPPLAHLPYHERLVEEVKIECNYVSTRQLVHSRPTATAAHEIIASLNFASFLHPSWTDDCRLAIPHRPRTRRSSYSQLRDMVVMTYVELLFDFGERIES